MVDYHYYKVAGNSAAVADMSVVAAVADMSVVAAVVELVRIVAMLVLVQSDMVEHE